MVALKGRLNRRQNHYSESSARVGGSFFFSPLSRLKDPDWTLTEGRARFSLATEKKIQRTLKLISVTSVINKHRMS